MSTRRALFFLLGIILFSACAKSTLVYNDTTEQEFEKFQFYGLDQFTYTHSKKGDKLVTMGTYIICDDDRLFLHFDSTVQKTHLLPVDRGQFRLTKAKDAENSQVSKISVFDKYTKQPLSFITIEGFLNGKKVLSEKPIEKGHLFLNPPLVIDSLSVFYLGKTIPAQLNLNDPGIFEIEAFLNSHASSNKVHPRLHSGLKTEMEVELKNKNIYKIIAPSFKSRVYSKK